MERLNKCLKNRKIRLNNTQDIKNNYRWKPTNNPTGSPELKLYGHFTTSIGEKQEGGSIDIYNILAQLNDQTKF